MIVFDESSGIDQAQHQQDEKNKSTKTAGKVDGFPGKEQDTKSDQIPRHNQSHQTENSSEHIADGVSQFSRRVKLNRSEKEYAYRDEYDAPDLVDYALICFSSVAPFFRGRSVLCAAGSFL